MPLNVGDLRAQLGLDIDSSSFSKGREAVNGTTKDLGKYANAFKRAENQVKRLSHSWEGLAGSKKYIDEADNALNRYRKDVLLAAESGKKLTKANDTFRTGIDSAKTGMIQSGKATTGLQSRMEDLTKSVQLALGPLSGVAARITAITALFNRSTIIWAGFFATATAGVIGFVKSIKAGLGVEKFLAQMNAQIRATGGAAGYTADQLNEMAKVLAVDTLTSTNEARDAVSALASYTSIAGDRFKETLNLAMDMSTVLGGGLTDAVKKLGKSLSDPGVALASLREAGIRFTKSEKEMLEVMSKTNRLGQAQDYILQKLKARFSGAAKGAAQGLAGALDTLGERLQHFFEALGTTEGVLPSVNRAITKLSDILAYLTENITNSTNKTIELTAGMKIVAKTIETVITNLDKLGAAVGLVVLYKGVSSLIGRFGQLDGLIGANGSLVRGVDVFRKTFGRLLLLFTAFEIGRWVGEWLRGFKTVRLVAMGFIGALEKGINHVTEFFELTGPKIKKAWGETFNWLKSSYADYIDTVVSGLKLADKVGLVPDSVIKSLEDWSTTVRSSITPLKELDLEIDKIKKKHQEERDAIDENVTGYFIYEMAQNSAEKAVKKNAGAVAQLTEEQKRNIASTLKSVDALHELIKEYVPGGEELHKFGVNMQILDGNTKVNEKGLRRLTISLQDYITAQENGNRNISPERIAQLTAEYNKLQASIALAGQEMARSNPATVMLNETKDTLDAMSKLTSSQKIVGFFDPSTISDAITFNKEIEKTKILLEGIKLKGKLGETRDALRAIAKERGLGKLLEGLNLEDVDGLAVGIERVKKATERTSVSFSAIRSTFDGIMNQMNQIVSAQLSAMQQMASYHKQMAKEAIEAGRSEANFYMDLADSIHYRNNVLAQSYENKAMAAATSAAAEYKAQKQQQAKADAAAKKAFENQKRLQKASIAVETATAAIKAFSSLASIPYVGPALGAAAAAAVVALGAKQMAIVDSQQYTPRERGGPITGGKPYLVGEKGPELIIPNSGGSVVNNRDLGKMGGGDINVSFQINATDATGFDRMLQSRRGMIVGMIRQAADRNMKGSSV